MNAKFLRIFTCLLALSLLTGPLYAPKKAQAAESPSTLTRPPYMLPPDESLHAIAFDSARPLKAAILAFSAAVTNLTMGGASLAAHYQEMKIMATSSCCFFPTEQIDRLFFSWIFLDALNVLQTSVFAPISSYLVKQSAVWPNYKHHLLIDSLAWIFYVGAIASYGFIWLGLPTGYNKLLDSNKHLWDRIEASQKLTANVKVLAITPILISIFGGASLVLFGVKGIIAYKMASYMQKREQNSQVVREERIKIMPTAAPLLNRRGQLDGATGGVALVF